MQLKQHIVGHPTLAKNTGYLLTMNIYTSFEKKLIAVPIQKFLKVAKVKLVDL